MGMTFALEWFLRHGCSVRPACAHARRRALCLGRAHPKSMSCAGWFARRVWRGRIGRPKPARPELAQPPLDIAPPPTCKSGSWPASRFCAGRRRSGRRRSASCATCSERRPAAATRRAPLRQPAVCLAGWPRPAARRPRHAPCRFAVIRFGGPSVSLRPARGPTPAAPGSGGAARTQPEARRLYGPAYGARPAPPPMRCYALCGDQGRAGLQ